MAAAAAGAALVAVATLAYAHIGADVEVLVPAEGATVAPTLEIVLGATGGETGVANVTLELDGDTVNSDGTISANTTFAGLTIPAGGRRTITVRRVLLEGPHQLTVRYTDPDDIKSDVVRNFNVDSTDSSRGAAPAVAVVVVAALLLAAAVVIRRRAFAQR